VQAGGQRALGGLVVFQVQYALRRGQGVPPGRTALWSGRRLRAGGGC